MAEKDLELNLLLKGTVTPSVKKVLDANAAFKKDLSELKGIAKDMRLDPFKDLATQVVRQRAVVEDLNDEYRQLDRQLRASGEGAEVAARKYLQLLDAQQQLSATEAALQQQLAASSRSKFGIGQAGNAISGVSRGLGAVGLTGASSQLNAAGDLFDLAEGAKKITDEAPGAIKNLAEAAGGFKKLALGVGGITLAAGALTAGALILNTAFKAQREKQQELAEAAENATQKLQDYYTFLASATSTDLDVRQAEIQARLETNQRTITNYDAALTAAAADLEDNLTSYQQGLLATTRFEAERQRLLAGFLEDQRILVPGTGEITSYKKLKDERDGLYQQNHELTGQINQLTAAYQDAAVAANDAAQAQKAFTDWQVSLLNARLANEETAAKRGLTWSSEQLAARQAEIDIERAMLEERQAELQQMQASGMDVAGALVTVAEGLTALADEEDYLNTVVREAVTAREAEAAALERYQELAEETKRRAAEEAEAQQKALDLQADYAAESEKIEANRTTTSLREQEDWERQQAQSLVKHYADLAALDEQFYDSQAQLLEEIAAIGPATAQAEAKALVEYNRDSQKLARDHKNKMLDIQQSLENGQAEAVEDRSISAAIEAVRAAQQQAEDENQQYAEEKERRDEDYQLRLTELKEQRDEKLAAAQKELDDLRQKHQKERTAKCQAYQQEQALAAENRRMTLQRQREDWQREDTERQQHLTQQLNKLGMHNTNVATATGTHYKNLEVIHAAGMRKIETAATQGYDRLVKNLDSLAAAAGNAKQLTGSSGGEMSAPKKYARGGTPKPFSIGTVGDGGGPENVLFMGYNRVFPTDFNLKQLPMGGDTYQFQFTVQGGGAMMDEQRLQSFFETRIIPRITTAIQQKRGVSR